MKRWAMVVGIGLVAGELAVGATLIRYVSVDGTNNPPYTNWADAATNIATAVTAANANNAGDIVWISNGPHQVSATITIGNTKVRGFTGDYRDVVVTPTAAVALACFNLDHPNAELSALTISNAVGGNNGGAVRFAANAEADAPPAGLVSNCLITSCTAGRGAGMMIAGSNNAVANCVIEGNIATVNGVVYFEGGGGTVIADTWIRNNRTTNAANTAYGGGLHLTKPNCTIRDTTISGNSVRYTSGGAGIYATQPGTFIRCQISSNTCEAGTGAGVAYMPTALCYPVFSNCTIIGNYAAGSGGGMYIRTAATLYNCLIAGNTTAAGFGGGIYFSRYTSEVHNCTIVQNSMSTTTSSSGGGIHGGADTGNGMGIFINTIIYSNWITHATSVHSNYNTAWGHVFSNSCTVPLPTNGTGNIPDKPGLRDMAAGEYEPLASSPCIDKGLNLGWMNGAADWAGRERLDRFTRQVDIGACEYVYPGSLMSVR